MKPIYYIIYGFIYGTQNSVSQKIRILHKIYNKRYLKQKGFWKVCLFLCTQYLVGPPFAWITASMRRGMKTISLWHCSGVMKHRFFSSSALLGLVSLIFLLNRFSLGLRSGEFAGQSSTVTHGHWTSFWYLWQCVQVPSPARNEISISIKLVSRRKHEVL